MARLDEIPASAAPEDAPDQSGETLSDKPIFDPGTPAQGAGDSALTSRRRKGAKPKAVKTKATPEPPDDGDDQESDDEATATPPAAPPAAATPAADKPRSAPMAVVAPSEAEPAPATAGPAPAAPDPAQAIYDGLERLEKVLLNTQTAIADALKSPEAPAKTYPNRRSIRLAAWTGLAAVVLSSGLTYGAITYLAIDQEPVDPRLRGWADSWSYLWRASPDFRQCWTAYLSTRQPQECRLTLGGPAAQGGRS